MYLNGLKASKKTFFRFSAFLGRMSLGAKLLALFAPGCSSAWINDLPSYPLYDIEKKIHRYSEKISIEKEKHPKQYCQEHFEWEKIITKYTKNGIEYKIIGRKK